jgi:2-phosphosulfolactate phosphatase
VAVAAFEYFRGKLSTAIRECGSGMELIERGFAADVDLAAQHDVSDNVPLLVNGAFLGSIVNSGTVTRA